MSSLLGWQIKIFLSFLEAYRQKRMWGVLMGCAWLLAIVCGALYPYFHLICTNTYFITDQSSSKEMSMASALLLFLLLAVVIPVVLDAVGYIKVSSCRKIKCMCEPLIHFASA